MKTKLLQFILYLSFLMIGNLFAAPVSHEDAAKVAKTFLFERMHQYGEKMDEGSIGIRDWHNVEGAYYIFNMHEGWVIVAARSERWPVIGYNFHGNLAELDEMPPSLKSWLQTIVDEAAYIESQQLEPSPEVAALWDYYLTNDLRSLDVLPKRDVATPLLTNTWNQNHPYNIYCPVDPNGPGGHVYVGCVATAMTMIMHYWRYPYQGQGQHQYYASPYGMQYANFGEAHYNWDAMQDVIENTHPHDVALISYHAAVSVNMMFSPDGSGAYSFNVPGAMTSRFKYSNAAQYLEKNNYQNADWEIMLQQQLDAGIPLYYSGYSSTGGHAFVCDGYQGNNYYHFNFGWGGSSNGWFSLQNVGGFSSGQGMVRNLVPNDPDYPYIAAGDSILAARSGSFTDGSGPVDDYPAGMNASWLISPQSEIDSVVSITLGFRKFNTDTGDILRVYEGPSTDDPLVAEYSGVDMPPALTIENNQVLVTFSSSGSAPGFVAEYVSTAPSWCNPTNFYTEPHGRVEDGSGQYHYNNGTTCIFIIEVPDATEYTLTFEKFSTEAESDLLRVIAGNNQTIATLSGQSIPEPIVVNSHAVYLAWSTNAVLRDEGWDIYYETDAVGLNEEQDRGDFILYPNPATEQLSMKFSTSEPEMVTFKLVNTNGQVVHNHSEPVNGAFARTISVEGLAKGIYVLHISGNKKILTRKIVLQ